MENTYHVPVMLEEVIHGLNIKPNGIYVDCTFGGGGHSKGILERLDNDGQLVVFDQDEDALKNSFKDSRLIFVPHNFRHLKRFLRLNKIHLVDGILADLGVSSHQFDEGTRGFSTRFDAQLDMRMDRRQTVKASDILNTYPAEKLQKVFEKYGEVTNAKTLANRVVTERMQTPFSSIVSFKDAIYSIVKGNPNKYLAQVFQALRIEVNEEMIALQELLIQIPEVLSAEGRAVFITFHSLEDRLVKNFFKTGSFEEIEVDVFGNRKTTPFKLINKKPLTASENELKSNPRSRSAKVRIAEKNN